MKKEYDFRHIEKDKYDFWKNQGYFRSGINIDSKPFTIVIPPPNVTGKLHLGHAWDQTLQDIIIRRKRMQGYDALYLPGMDHAGIATQAKVDQRLRESGTDRYQLGRKKFLSQAWEWKKEYAEIIKQQWKAIGISVDYTKERFTLDEEMNHAVNEVFIRLYKKGMIYRDYRIISWDSEANTALSNIEVEFKETRSKLYYIKYPLVEEKNQFLEIATTRPETMFADQALMVNPDDKRFKNYVGKEVFIPGTNKKIPVIEDEYVDSEFGTGVVKVTPAHDPNDFIVGKKHNMKMPLCIDEHGKMNKLSGQYENLDRFACRKKLIEDLKKIELISKIEDYINNVGYSQRTGVVVEPRLSLQWFVKMDELSASALKTNVRFVPERFKKIFNQWMTGTLDWCISRQLWWGHRIPAWYKDNETKVQIESPGDGWVQDEDVLDTWFSSALWPFSTLGWPKNTSDFKRYYPTDVLVTGYDIIFFWVARMIFQGLEFTKKDPFKEVLIHGLIRDSKGQKMSKSLGNGVDPMDVIDKYGIDALRYFLTTNSAPGLDMRYDEKKIDSSWNFLNKLWHATRFVKTSTSKKNEIDQNKLKILDKGILNKLSNVIKKVDIYYDKYEFSEVAKYLYNFIWDDYANSYLEFAKEEIKKPERIETVSSVLRYVLINILKLMHPFVPFITDNLYEELTGNKTLMIDEWPNTIFSFDPEEEILDGLNEFIKKMRNFRSETQNYSKLDLSIHIENQLMKKIINENIEYLIKTLKLNSLSINEKMNSNEKYFPIVFSYGTAYLIEEQIKDNKKDFDVLILQKKKLELEIDRSKKLMNNKNFLSKANPTKVENEKKKYKEYLSQYKEIMDKINEIK